MALFNKFFSSRNKNANKAPDAACERKVFAFSNEQVRVILFRECDFRGRKLLFDSRSVQKVPLLDTTQSDGSAAVAKVCDKYVEVSDGHGYAYGKPGTDIAQLGEMVFGTVAMSYRGTSLKIHSLGSPPCLMCTQIFSSPRYPTRACSSAPSQTCPRDSITSTRSLEYSVRLDDSGVGSSEHFSVRSADSDTMLICKRPHSLPHDLPSEMDSLGTCAIFPQDQGGRFEKSFSNGSHSYSNTADGTTITSGNLYRRWLRSASASLDRSGSSLLGSASADECFLKSQHRNSKLGLAVVIELPGGQENDLEQFLLEHVSLLELMVWRTRRGAEAAYLRHAQFLSLMLEVSAATSRWLTALLAGPQLASHMWLSLSPICDKFASINFSELICDGRDSYRTRSFRTAEGCDVNESDEFDRSSDFTFLNLTKYLKSEWAMVTARGSYGCKEKNMVAEKYITELCELLDSVDAKTTNFFLSTLVTAVLTYHLGWVSTVLPPTATDKDTVAHIPCNPLWGQLTDLYGAIGHPTRVAHTIVTGTNKAELVSKVLNSLTFFIRCGDLERKCMGRVDVDAENRLVDGVCDAKDCIPKVNYKRYEDHLREMQTMHDGGAGVSESIELRTFRDSSSRKQLCVNQMTNLYNLKKSKSDKSALDVRLPRKLGLGLCRTQTCLTDLNKADKPELDTKFGSVIIGERQNCDNKLYFSLGEKAQQSCSYSADLSALENNRLTGVESVQNVERGEEEAVLNNSCCSEHCLDVERRASSEGGGTGVVFVLGEDERLVGLKSSGNPVAKQQRKVSTSLESLVPKNVSRDVQHNSSSTTTFQDVPFSSRERPASISDDFFTSSNFKDSDFTICAANTNPIKSSTSWASLELKDELLLVPHQAPILETNRSTTRCQSVPPEIKPVDDQPQNEKKPKYRYSGVKFNFQQYPQIVTNYLRSKNLELSHLPFFEKSMEMNGLGEYSALDFPSGEAEEEDVEVLQTPSNASELEFTSDLDAVKYEAQRATEIVERKPKVFVRKQVPSTVIREASPENKVQDASAKVKLKSELWNRFDGGDLGDLESRMEIIEMPMPKSRVVLNQHPAVNFTSSLMRGIGDHYISDMVLQGTTSPKSEWESTLRKDLSMAARHSPLDQSVDEAVAIVANTDTWEVHLLSSHTYVVDKGSSGVHVGMSQLVANMLESLLHMWKMHTPPEHCIMHIEQRLQEFCILSKALADLLLATEFCSMELLTSVLHLEVNDVPLLMAVASTHSPQVTQKYGVSFQ